MGRTSLCLGFIMALTFATAVSPAVAQQGEDLVVQGSDVVTVDSTTLTVDGNVIVRESGTLVLRTAGLVLDQTADYQYTVVVQDEGTLRLEDDSRIQSNRYFRVTALGNATVELHDSLVRGEPQAAGRSSEMFIRNDAHLEADGSVLERIWVEFRGDSTGALNDVEAVIGNRLRTFDRSTLEVSDSELSFGFRDLEATHDSRLTVTGSRVRGHGPPFARDSARVTVEDSVWGTPGSIATNFWYYEGTPTVTFRNLEFLQGHIMRLSGSGDYVFDRSNVVVEEGGARSMQILSSETRLRPDSIGFLEVGPGSTASLMQGLPGQRHVDHLLARPDSTITVAFPGVVTVSHLNNECNQALILPGAVVPGEVDQTLTVRVVTAEGAAVPGASVVLLDATNEPVTVFDPDTGTSSAIRVTDQDGTTEYLFAPTGVLHLEATAPDDSAGTATAVVVTCQTVEIAVS